MSNVKHGVVTIYKSAELHGRSARPAYMWDNIGHCSMKTSKIDKVVRLVWRDNLVQCGETLVRCNKMACFQGKNRCAVQHKSCAVRTEGIVLRCSIIWHVSREIMLCSATMSVTICIDDTVYCHTSHCNTSHCRITAYCNTVHCHGRRCRV